MTIKSEKSKRAINLMQTRQFDMFRDENAQRILFQTCQ